MAEKACTRCGEVKALALFSRRASSPDGLQPCCKACVSVYKKANRERFRAYGAAYDAANPEATRARSARSREGHREERAAAQRVYYQEHREERLAYWAGYRAGHAPQIRAYLADYRRDRYANDIQFRLALVLRRRLWAAMQKNAKTGSAVRDLGCSIAALREHLERQFQPGMTWATYGKAAGCWSIDHIRPLVSFDLSDPAQCAAACHFSNLQPLWHSDNIRKGARMAA